MDTTQGVATIFPALTLTLIRLHQGDRAGAEAALALAGPIRSWTPSPAMRMAAWGHALMVAIDLGRTQDIEFLASQLEPFRGQHAANGAGPGSTWAPSSCTPGSRPRRWGAWTRRFATWRPRCRSAMLTAPAGTPCRRASNWPPRWPAGGLPAILPRPQAALDAAAGEAEQLGMVPFTKRIEQLRPRLPATSAGRSPLSPREVEVARLVARGLTNKQIGETLYVSERTAENHVQHILVKLGFSNRSQIAAWARDSRE